MVISKKNPNIGVLVKQKLDFYKNLIHKSLKSANTYRTLEVITPSEYNSCLLNLETLFKKCSLLSEQTKDKHHVNNDSIIKQLQDINDGLFSIFKNFGTENLEELLIISFGQKFVSELKCEKFKVLNEFFHPINFKIMKKNNIGKKTEVIKGKLVDDNMIVNNGNSLDCYDLGRTSTNFNLKLRGIKICFQNKKENKCLLVNAVVDDIILDLYENEFVNSLLLDIENNKPDDDMFNSKEFDNFMKTISLRDLMVYSNDEIYNKFNGYLNQIDLMKQRSISQLVRDFINDTLYQQRTRLIQLLLCDNNPEQQYLCYLLYDLLSNDDKGNVDTKEQQIIYDSLPWYFKKLFKTAMRSTNDYTKTLTNIDTNNIPLEQQICLMKVDDSVKEKAMVKLKEVKAKSEDSGSKARQYLDGLLKIPFGVYKYEPILKVMKDNNLMFKSLIQDLKNSCDDINEIEQKANYTPMEISKYNKTISEDYLPLLKETQVKMIIQKLTTGKRDELVCNIVKINYTIIKEMELDCAKLIHSGKKLNFLKNEIEKFITEHSNNNDVMNELIKQYDITNSINIKQITQKIDTVQTQWDNVTQNMENVRKILDDAVYGHKKAKRQIERIIGQWMSGKQTGYCFGFEGPPGLGKTTIAKKGLANCLKDEDGNPRPFGFIAIGGSSNGSLLDGHNYTYVGSTWGRIVDILIESKCMNPIIFIDELDKISKTEHGKEIIGILTHLVDTTQNDTFQDKYFNGIDIDLSKALFVFSYNDVNLLDRILLDRIHRVKFESLSIDEKIVVTRNHLLPEIYDKVNMKDMIEFSDELIEYIIRTYTCESGVRKLKEILFEIISEINLELLYNKIEIKEIPYPLSIDDVKHYYLKERHEMKEKTIHGEHTVGIINGLWANALGMGGIISIECNFYPSGSFLDLNLTGQQGDVMKESMSVAKTLAYKLTPVKRQKELVKLGKETLMQGVHIHCPEGATPKDGPSAGTAITVCLFSLLNNKKIKHDLAITGEINLQGNVTAIGGLEHKILGGIRAGVKEFLYPKENSRDFDKFWEKYGEKDVVDGITFREVETIEQVMKLVYV
jgi:ATP-dependent Lon protease